MSDVIPEADTAAETPTAEAAAPATAEPAAAEATAPAAETAAPEQVQPQQPTGASAPESTAVTSDKVPVGVQVDSGTVPAQVQGQPHPPQTEVPLHEVHVVADRVITDTSDPLAVQVPKTGLGDALTPIGRAFADAKTPEDAFTAAA